MVTLYLFNQFSGTFHSMEFIVVFLSPFTKLSFVFFLFICQTLLFTSGRFFLPLAHHLLASSSLQHSERGREGERGGRRWEGKKRRRDGEKIGSRKKRRDWKRDRGKEGGWRKRRGRGEREERGREREVGRGEREVGRGEKRVREESRKGEGRNRRRRRRRRRQRTGGGRSKCTYKSLGITVAYPKTGFN